MESQKERFVFYEFLLFFWSKKWFLVMVPIITMAIALGLSQLYQETNYKGSTTIYVGGVTKDLTKAELVQMNYKSTIDNELIRETLRVSVPTSQIIKIDLAGTNKDLVEKELSSISTAYFNDLMAKHDEEVGININLVELTEKVINSKESLLNDIYGQLNLLSDESTSVQLLREIKDYEEEIYENTLELQKYQLEISNYEEPKLISQKVTEVRDSTTTILLLGFIAGAFFAIACLVFWKYIKDARKHMSIQ